MTVEGAGRPVATKDDGAAPPSKDIGLGEPVAQSADPIDRIVSLAPKWTVFVLAACGLLVLGVLVWAFQGTVTTMVSTPGLYSENGSSRVLTDTQATVNEVLAPLGATVTKGDTVVTLVGGGTVTAPQSGTVTAVFVSPGSIMYPGKTMMRITDLDTPDNVVIVIPASMTGTVTVGLPVQLAVSSAPPSQYGYLLGTVDEISSGPYTSQQIADILRIEEEVVAQQLGSEPALLGMVKLVFDPSTPSNYQWTVGEGPPFVITQGVPVTANIILSEKKPIQVVFPGLGASGTSS
jgi:hypothetical protein